MTGRKAPPFTPGKEGDPNASGYFNFLYGAKKSCTIDLTKDAGRELVRRIAAKVDVMVDNFSTGVLEKLGLGYDVIQKVNPNIIMLSCGAFGRSGPMAGAMGFHSAVNLFSGVADVTGYADSHPRLMGGVLPDPMAGGYGAFAIMAALHHRNKTGQGQFIDMGMYEVMLALIPEAVLDLTMNDRDPARAGNRDRVKTPHGIYPCREDDRWIAISVDGEAEWAAFCAATGHAEWQGDTRFATAAARHANADALDAAVAGWTRLHAQAEATETLQAAGICAGPVLRTDELLGHPQLRARGMVVSSDHPVAGRYEQLGLPWRMDSVGVSYRRAPMLGEHTREICIGLVGMSAAEFAALEAEGVLS